MIALETAKKLVFDFQYLIGEEYGYHIGGEFTTLIIEDLLITPHDEPEFSQALKNYRSHFDSSIVHHAKGKSGYSVIAIFDRKREYYKDCNVYADLLNIISEKGIAIDYFDYGINI